MWYPSYLIHYNKNHSSKNGRFVSGDGDGDGILDDHHNYARNKQAQSGGGGSSDMDKVIGDQIDEMVRKYNNPEKPTTYTLKKKDDKKKKKKTSSGSKKTTKKKTASKITIDTFKDGVASVNQNNNGDWQNLSSNISSEDIVNLINENIGIRVSFIQQLLGK